MAEKKSTTDLSALLEVDPKQMDDRTGSIRSEDIQRAHREANKVLAAQKRTFRYFFTRFLALIFLISAIGGIIYLTSNEDFQKWMNKRFRKLVFLADVTEKDNDILNSIASASLDSEGPKLRFAVSTNHLEKPSLYVATNLPQGVVLHLVLIGKLGQILSKSPVNIQIPITIVKNMGKTPPIHLKNGQPLPSGQYLAIIYNDDEQPQSIKDYLSTLPERNEQPKHVPKGRKIIYSEQVLLGEINSAQFQEKITNFRNKARNEAQTELQNIKLAVQFLENLLQTSATQGRSVYTKLKNSKARKQWKDYHSRWDSNHPILKSILQYYPASITLLQMTQKDLQSFHDRQEQFIEHQGSSKDQPETLEQTAEQIKQKIFQIKNWIASTESQFSDPLFYPSSGTDF